MKAIQYKPFAGTLNGVNQIQAPVVAHAAGTGTLSCAGAVSTGGAGTITFTNSGDTVGFGVNLVGTGSEVTFTLTGNAGGAGVGHASFAANGTRALECNSPGGLNNLGFSIQATAANLSG